MKKFRKSSVYEKFFFCEKNFFVYLKIFVKKIAEKK